MGAVWLVVAVASYGALAGALGVAAVTDLSRRVVPNGCVVAVAASGVARALVDAPGGPGAGSLAGVSRAAAGGATVLGVMLAAALVSSRGRGSPGVGGGDVKLLSALGLWVGPVGGLAVLALSCLASVAVWALGLLARSLGGGRAARAGRRRDRVRALARETVPLAPAIAAVGLPVALADLVAGLVA